MPRALLDPSEPVGAFVCAQGGCAIIEHDDVKRMLLLQKAYAEGGCARSPRPVHLRLAVRQIGKEGGW